MTYHSSNSRLQCLLFCICCVLVLQLSLLHSCIVTLYLWTILMVTQSHVPSVKYLLEKWQGKYIKIWMIQPRQHKNVRPFILWWLLLQVCCITAVRSFRLTVWNWMSNPCLIIIKRTGRQLFMITVTYVIFISATSDADGQYRKSIWLHLKLQ